MVKAYTKVQQSCEICQKGVTKANKAENYR